MTESEGFRVTDRRVTPEEANTASAADQAEPTTAETPKETAEQACSKGAPKDGRVGPGCEHLFPKATFSTFVLSLSASALTHLGEAPEPESGQTAENLPLAKHTIDILAMLKDKTEGNRTPDETRLLDGVLYELRMQYVLKSQ